MTMSNHKALQILFDTYWSSAGWKSNPTTPPDDFEYASAAGYMFEPVEMSHDQVLTWLEKSLQAVRLEDVSNAFLASLSTRRRDLRSALGSYAVARHFPRHEFYERYGCAICGAWEHSQIDRSVLNFERHKWGGVRHEHPEYIAFDLELFARLEKGQPSSEDIDIMRRILESARTADRDARPRDLEKRSAKVVKSNEAERRVLLEILGYCGILQPQGRPGYFDTFITDYHRDPPPPGNKNDWKYPVSWWRGSDGVNQKAVEYYFPQLLR
jgi:hypothetical protein